MANLHAPKYTVDQEHRIAQGRKRLIERWSTETFSVGQPRSFSVDYRTTFVDRDGAVYDQFRASPAAPAFSDVWRQELERQNFRVEHGSRLFDVLVPHSYFLRQRLLPVSVDAQCAVHSMVYAFVASFLAWSAWRIGFD